MKERETALATSEASNFARRCMGGCSCPDLQRMCSSCPGDVHGSTAADRSRKGSEVGATKKRQSVLTVLSIKAGPSVEHAGHSVDPIAGSVPGDPRNGRSEMFANFVGRLKSAMALRRRLPSQSHPVGNNLPVWSSDPARWPYSAADRRGDHVPGRERLSARAIREERKPPILKCRRPMNGRSGLGGSSLRPVPARGYHGGPPAGATPASLARSPRPATRRRGRSPSR